MLDCLSSIGLGLVGVLAGWLKCFEHNRPTRAGYVVISLISVLTLLNAINPYKKKQKAEQVQARNEKTIKQVRQQNETLCEQMMAENAELTGIKSAIQSVFSKQDRGNLQKGVKKRHSFAGTLNAEGRPPGIIQTVNIKKPHSLHGILNPGGSSQGRTL